MNYSDQQMEEQMGLVLRAGLVLACAVMVIGGVLYMTRHADELPVYQSFHGAPAGLNSAHGVWRDAISGSARGIIQLSVLLMIATPVMRVVFAVYGFARQKQWAFAVISVIVLGLLGWGLLQKG